MSEIKPIEPGGVAKAIQSAVAAAFDLDRQELLSDRRGKAVAGARQMAMALTAELTGWSTPKIGSVYRRDHTTVLHALRVTAERVALDPELGAVYQALRADLRARLPTPIEPAPQERAEALVDAVEITMQGELREVFARLRAAARRNPILVIGRLQAASIDILAEAQE